MSAVTPHMRREFGGVNTGVSYVIVGASSPRTLGVSQRLQPELFRVYILRVVGNHA